MFINRSVITTLAHQSQKSWQEFQTLSAELTVGNRILLRLLVCTASFVVGVGYGDRQEFPVSLEPLTTAKAEPGNGLQLVNLATRLELALTAPEEIANAEPEWSADPPTENPEPTPEEPPAPEPEPTAEEPPAPEPEPIPEPEPEPVTIRIRAVGDIVPGTNYPNNHLHPNPRELFAAVQPFLEGGDVLFGNFESTMTRSNAAAKDVRRPNVFAFRNPPEYAQLLAQMGFDVLSVANNHAYDFGAQGFADTVANIEAAGMAAVGVKGKVAYTEVKGLRIGWIGFSTSPNQNSILALGSAASLVKEAEANADIVVVSFHGGAEGTGAAHTRNQTEYFFGENRGNLVEFSRQMVAAGADLVLGHGPHIPRAMELYQGRLIAYSLGNFVGYRTLSTQGALAYSLVLEAELDDQGNFQRGQIYPVLIARGGIPQRSTRSESIALIRRLTATDFPATPLVITLDGRLQLPDAGD